MIRQNINVSGNFLLILILTVIMHSCSVKRNTYIPRIFKTTTGNILPYNIYYPESYNKKEKTPLLIMLHGAGERGSDNTRQLIHVAPLLGRKAISDKYPAVLLWPQCPEEDYWAPVKRFEWVFEEGAGATRAMQSLMSLIDQILKDKNIDHERIYIAGLSMGGFGTLDLLSRIPEKIAAAVPICGGADLTKAGNYADIPLWIFHGAKDNVVGVKQSRDLVSLLKLSGADVRYTEYPEGDHDVWNEAFSEPELLPWLFSQRKRKNNKN